MHQPDLPLLVAVLTLTAAAAMALVTDQLARQPGRAWRYPVMVVATAAVNIGLIVAVAFRPEPLTGTIVLGSALLLVYAAHRRARAASIHWPPRRRRPTR
jgi:hypothetical protein